LLCRSAGALFFAVRVIDAVFGKEAGSCWWSWGW
jgi:hypothetical protein